MSLPRTPDLVAASAEQPYRFPWGRIFGELDQHSEETRWPDHFHPAHELLWAQGGAITVLVGRRLWTVAGSQALWIPAGPVYSGTVPAGVTSRVTFFDPEHTPARSEEPASVEITPLLGQLLEHLRTEDLGDGERHRAEAVVMDLVKPVPQPVILQMPTHELIAGAAEEILADPAASHGLDSWAERLGVSSRTLTRLFRSETGLGFRGWVTTARVKCSIESLAEGASVAEAGRSVGYATTSAFGVAFRRVTGMTPGEFRHE